ncbi:hypothetical protein C5E08_03370 [Rathayibacter iranicus]|uniref:Uncharacterized protein n=2 Tax=Rathayibacter iranicus TaxID=59737 RepID=A0AAD1AF48_9MICO|nr:hypothetical protein C7V51_03360 [Rathayibacter iranicus]PPI61939.1 hypothetical protein C5E08_03370 [Rathayibacter iranicus]
MDAFRVRWEGGRMSKPRTKFARAALIFNGMVWFDLSLMLFAIAGEQTYAASTATIESDPGVDGRISTQV